MKRKKQSRKPFINPRPIIPNPRLRLNHWRSTRGKDLAVDQAVELEAQARQRLGGMTLAELPAELKTCLTDPRYRPWKVTMWIQDNAFADVRPVTYFVRGPEAEHVIMQVAIPLWQRWERTEAGIHAVAEYPCIPDGAALTAEALDEGDWKSYLNEAKRWANQVTSKVEILLVGDPRHPMFWTVPGMVFDVPGYAGFDPDPHRNYDRRQPIISDDSMMPDWGIPTIPDTQPSES